MATSTAITLGDHFVDLTDSQVAHGRFGSAREGVRAGLRLLKEHEAKVKRCRTP